MVLSLFQDKYQKMVTGQSPGQNLPISSWDEYFTMASTASWDQLYEQARTESQDQYKENDLTAGWQAPLLQTGIKAPTSYWDELQEDGANPTPEC